MSFKTPEVSVGMLFFGYLGYSKLHSEGLPVPEFEEIGKLAGRASVERELIGV